MNLQELQRRFAHPDASLIEGPGGLPFLDIHNAHARARISLYGGQILDFQPHGQEPLLWTSPKAHYTLGKSIRGGNPLCWPWFGPPANRSLPTLPTLPTQPSSPDSETKNEKAAISLPAHGFARLRMWSLSELKNLSDGSTFIRLTLHHDESTLPLWPFPFSLETTLTIGHTLSIDLLSINRSNQTLRTTAAQHTYFNIGAIEEISIFGLESTHYIDHTDSLALKLQQGPIRVDREVNRVYTNTAADCIIQDGELHRKIRLHKIGSHSTVVWNPWVERTKTFDDLDSDAFYNFLCVETSNTAEDAAILAPNERHCLGIQLSIEPL